MNSINGKTYTQKRITLEKPYLSIPGFDYFGYARLQKASDPLLMHSHENVMEIVFVMDGEQTYETEDGKYHLIGGQAFLTYPGQMHRSAGYCQDVSDFYWIHLNLSCIENFLGLGRELSLATVEEFLEIRQQTFCFDVRIRKLLKRCFDEFEKKGTTLMAISSLTYLLHLILEAVHKEKKQENRFLELERYIDDHITEKLHMEDLSRVCNFSVSTLQHRFKDYFGRSPAEYINYKKISRSKELLLEGNSVTETAGLLGFNTSDYFSTVFRKFTGMSPTQWLRNNAKHDYRVDEI